LPFILGRLAFKHEKLVSAKTNVGELMVA